MLIAVSSSFFGIKLKKKKIRGLMDFLEDKLATWAELKVPLLPACRHQNPD